LLSVTNVELNRPLAEIVSRPGRRTACARCGEEIINDRQVVRDGVTFCRACAGEAYYRPAAGD
jgi:formylmethanofuran dehydrogenase subunit E